jgi:serine/threonine protein kinase
MDPLLLRQEVGNTLGTAEYVAPEQVDDSLVDIRADIYALGATFYFLLTGNNPFPEAKTTQEKLTFQLVRRPKPVRDVRPEVPQELAEVVDKMMAKEIGERYQTPAEVAEALAPWTQAAIAPPSEEEMPPRIVPDRGTPNSARPTSSKIGPATPKEVTGPFTPRDPVLERESLSPVPSSSEIPILSSEMKPPTPAPKAPAAKGPAAKAPASAPGKAPTTASPAKRPAPAAASAAPQDLKKTGPQAVVRRPAAEDTTAETAEAPSEAPAKVPAKAPKADLKKTMTMSTARAAPAEQDADERFARRVLIAGASIFSAGVGLLLWWLLFGS